MSRPVIVVVGAGPGVSGSVARRFADEGYDVALLGADRQALDDLVPDLEARGATVGHTVADVTDEQAARDAVRRFGEHTGRIDVLHFNPSAFREKDPLALTVEELLEDVALGVGALLTVVQAARPFMSGGGRVSVTGSMAADEPWGEPAEATPKSGARKSAARPVRRTLPGTGARLFEIDPGCAPGGRCSWRSPGRNPR